MTEQMHKEAASSENGEMDETKLTILNAALGLFSSDGYNEATVRDIADAAEVNQALLFRLFKNKKELFLATYTYASERSHRDAENIFRSFSKATEDRSCELVLDEMIRSYYKLVFDNIDLLRMSIISRPFVEELRASPNGPLIDILSARMLERLQAMGLRAKEGMPLQQIARWLTSDIIRECLDAYLHDDRHIYDETLERDLKPKRDQQGALIQSMLLDS